MQSLPLNKRLGFILLSILFATLVSCDSSGEKAFVGCYAIEENGEAVLKITKDGGKYFATIDHGAEWGESVSLRSGTPEEVKELFREDSEKVRTSLVADEDSFGIFLVTPGDEFKGHKAETKYISFLGFSAGSVYKVSCK